MNNKKYANLLNKIKMKGHMAKAVALAMCFVLFTTSVDITAFAFTGGVDSDKNIVGITSPSDEIANQKVGTDATLEDIEFPEILDVHVSYQVEKEIEVEVEEEKATPTPTPSVEPTPTVEPTHSTEPTPSAEVAPTETPEGDDDTAPKATGEENNQNEDTESQPDGEQVAKISNGEYDSIETVYVPMTYYAAEPSAEEVVVETLEKDDSADDEIEPKEETKTETVIEEVASVSVEWSLDEEKSSKTEFKDLEVGEKYIFVPAITEDGYKLAEGVGLPIITVTVDEKQAAFEKSVTVDDVVITVMADDAVFPEGATIEARKVTTSEEKEVEEAIDEVRDEEKNVAVSYTFDITIYDKDGNEIEPDTEKGSVKVTFKMAEIANENLETEVYHVEETDAGLNAEGLDVNTEEGEADEAAIETDGFSFYTVEFTYNELQYVLEGDERVELSTILDAVGIKENGEISKVEGSDDELFKPVSEDDIWYIEAVKAFSSEEWMKVTIGGVEYEIVVTDDQTVTTWAELKNALSGTDETITLGGSIQAISGSETLQVSGTKTLDLNGYTINGKRDDSTSVGSVIKIPSGATLNLKDSGATAKHYFKVGEDGLWTLDTSATSGTPIANLTARPAKDTIVEVSGGCITGGFINSKDTAGGVHISGTFTMNGGNIVGNKSMYRGGGTYVSQSGIFNLESGSLVGNIACGSGWNDGGGGGVCVYGGKLNMSGGFIGFNNATAYSGGGVMHLDASNGEFTMSAGNIEFNYAKRSGAGVCINKPFSMSGGKIANNIANIGGAGVYVTTSTFTMTGGEISKNTANGTESGKGGIYVNGSIVLGGTAKVTENKNGDTVQNIYLNNKTITVGTDSNAPKDGMSVGVTASKIPTLTAPVNITGTNGADYSSYFVSDNQDYVVKNVDNIVKLMKKGTITNGTPESAKATNFGYISIDKETALAGETVTVTATPNIAYSLKSLKYNDGSNHDITSAKIFTMPSANVTVTAEFEHNHNFTYTVNGNVLKATCIDGCPGGYYANPLTLTLTKPANLAYDGNAKEISFASEEKTKWEATGTGLGMVPTINYAAKTGSSLTDNKPVKVGSYTASITVSDKTASLDFEITKAASSVTNAPVANSLTYNGADQALVSAGTASGGTMNYAIGNDSSTAPTSDWSTEIPTGENAGDYYVWYKSKGDGNHSDTTPVCVTVTIAKKSITVSGITATNRAYVKDNKSVELVTTGATLTGKVDGDDLSVTATGEMADANAGENKSVTIKNLTLAGAGKDNYELASSGQQTSTTVTITKASHTVTAPTARNPVYNGNEQVLISAGNCATGEILYSFSENGTYTADINDIKAKAVGTYTVYYKVLGDGNYNEYTSKSLTAKIASKPTPTPDPPKPDPDPQPTPAPDPIKPTPTPEKPIPTPKNPIPVIPIEPKPTNTIPVIKLEDTEEEKVEEAGESEVLGDITEIEETEKPDMGIKVRTMQVGEGNIRVDAETSETSPIQVANVETQIADLVDHSDIFTKEDVKEINSGADARVWINVDEMDMSIVSEEEQAEVLEIAKSLGGENEGLLYFDITLLKQVGSGDITNIHEPGMDIEVSLEIPETIRNTNPNVKREYSVIRIHDGKVKNLGGEYDEETGLIVFRTEKFSTYVLAYADKPIDTLEVISDTDSADAVVKSGMITPLSVILSLILLAGLGLIIFFVIRRKKQEEQ